jgi:hypothetical protein
MPHFVTFAEASVAPKMILDRERLNYFGLLDRRASP